MEKVACKQTTIFLSFSQNKERNHTLSRPSLFDSISSKGIAVDEVTHNEEVQNRKFKGKAYRLGHTLGEPGATIPVAETLKEDYVDVTMLFYKDFIVVEGRAFAVGSPDAQAIEREIEQGKIPRIVTDILLPRYNHRYSDVPTVALRMCDYGDMLYSK